MRSTLWQLRCFCAVVFVVALMDHANARSSTSPLNFSSVSALTHPARFTTPSSTTNDQICEQVRNIFAMKQLQSTTTATQFLVQTNETSTRGNHSRLCPSSSVSCCSSELEARFDEMVTREFLDIMQSTSSYLKNLIATNAARFEENLLGLVRTSENSTTGLFADVYKRMASPASELIGQLYGSLTDFVRGVDVDAADAVSAFFDGLFPLVYHHSINPKLGDFDDDYKECLSETQAEVLPFGDVPSRLSIHVARAFLAARTFLQALHLGVEVLNSTDHLEVASECRRSLTRLLYCPLCQGLVHGARSCNGYCTNVVRGCLANAAELDQPWNEYVAALHRLATGMKGGAVLGGITATLHTKISEAIMHAMENGPELSKKVKKACGHPKRAARDVPGPLEGEPIGAASQNTTALHSGSPVLSAHMQAFLHGLQSSKGFYAGLADTLCNDDTLAVRTEVNCWNGDTLGEYTKTIAGVGLSAQKYNPELKMQHWRDAKISQLADKLKHMKQILYSRTMSFPDSDSLLVNDGSGSGWMYNGGANNHFEDDEDYPANSGSGGNDPTTWVDENEETRTRIRTNIDLGFKGDEEEQQKPSITVPPSSAAPSHSPAFGLVFLALVLLSSLIHG